MTIKARRKKKQSASRNADTQFMNKLWRENERARAARSQEIRDRERRARDRARAALEALVSAHA